MKVLKEIIYSDKTNFGKLELVKQLEDAIIDNVYLMKVAPQIRIAENTFILGNILDEIKTKSTWGKNQLKDLFLDKILQHLGA